VTDLANQRNIKEVGSFLEGEIRKAKKMQDTANTAAKKEDGTKETAVYTSTTNEYRYLLIKCVNQITQMFPETIPSMIGPLMDSFLMFEKKGSMASLETIIFIREVIEVYPEHRQSILKKLCSLIGTIRNHLVMRVAVWIIGEYSQSSEEVEHAFGSIKRNIGSLPIFTVKEEDDKKEKTEATTTGPRMVTKTIIMPDGSYGTETIMIDENTQNLASQNEDDQLPLRKCLKNTEDDFLASCLAISLTKLTVKCKKNLKIKFFNKMTIESSLVICALLKSNRKQVDTNNLARLQLCLKILTTPKLLKSTTGVQKVLADQGKRIFQKFLESNSRLLNEKSNDKDQKEQLIITQPDEAVQFRQLKGKQALTEFDITEEISDALGGDVGGYEDFLGDIKKDMDSKVYQLTGFSDEIYAEAFMEVHHYDILLKIVLMNRTNKTLSNINFELLTQGNLKIVEKPVPISLRPESSATIKASLKVSSTDNGIIYGNLTYESSSSTQPELLNINEIQIDFINDLMKAETTELEFKKKWAEYEWENKVQVNTTITDLKQYVSHFAESLNVSLMTKLDTAESQSSDSFLVANFYTKSKFEEDCLLNMSVERVILSSSETKIQGLIRLRAKTEGMALCVGEKCKLIR
jgi:coatomer subunit beta